MGTTVGPEALPVPQPTDQPDGPGAIQALVQQLWTGGPYVQDTLAHLQGMAGKYLNQKGVVNNDTATPANNGEYLWSGSAWVFFAPLSAQLARVSLAGAFSTSSTGGSYLAVPWDTDIVNIGSVPAHSTSTNKTRFTAAVPGYYRIHGNARINITTGAANAQIAKNGTAITDTIFSITPAAGAPAFVVCEDIVQLNAGDYLEFWVASSQTSIGVGSASCSFQFMHP